MITIYWLRISWWQHNRFYVRRIAFTDEFVRDQSGRLALKLGLIVEQLSTSEDPATLSALTRGTTTTLTGDLLSDDKPILVEPATLTLGAIGTALALTSRSDDDGNI